MVEQPGKLQAQLGIAFKLRRQIGKQGALFQRRYQASAGRGCGPDRGIQAADAENEKRGLKPVVLRPAKSSDGGAAADAADLGADADIHGVALRPPR